MKRIAIGSLVVGSCVIVKPAPETPVTPTPPEPQPAQPTCSAGTDDVVLDVPYEQQRIGNWCWAATTRMVLSFYGKTTTQCEIAKKALPACTCTESSVVASCDKTEWPPFKEVGFASKRTDLLSETELMTELSCGRPLLFTWNMSSGGAHIMVADGFRNLPDEKELWVFAQDPQNGCVAIAPNAGANQVVCDDGHSVLLYEYYDKWSKHHSHSYDFSKLAPEIP